MLQQRTGDVLDNAFTKARAEPHRREYYFGWLHTSAVAERAAPAPSVSGQGAVVGKKKGPTSSLPRQNAEHQKA
jgi:hypothetical protein